MTMSKKDYEAVASLLAGELAINQNEPKAARAIINTTLSLADTFRRLNPRFDRERFYKAVGLPEQFLNVKKVQK